MYKFIDLVEPRLVPLTADLTKTLRELSQLRSLTTNHVFLYEGKPLKKIKRAFHTTIRTERLASRTYGSTICATVQLLTCVGREWILSQP
jgi:hypothetical protein